VKELAHLNKYLFKYKHLLLLGLLFIIISNIFQILPAQYVRYALDLVIDNLNVYKLFDGQAIQEEYNENIKRSVVIYGLIILGMALLRGFFLFLVRQTIIVMSRHIEYDLKNEIYEQYQSLPISFYRRNNTGDLLARISEDVSKVRMYIGPAIMYGLNLLTLFLMLIPIMFAINFRLTMYALIPLPFLSFSIYYVHNKINRRSEEIQRSLSGLSTFVQEAFSGIRVLKSFAREQESAERFADKSEEYKLKSLRLTRVNAMFFPLILFLIGLSIILTVFVGGSEVINGTLSFGNIAEFIIYINLLTWPVTSLGWITSIVQRAAASQKRINQFLEEKNHIKSKEAFERARKCIPGGVEHNLAFNYPFPLTSKRVFDCYMETIDDIVLTDYLMDGGPIILGHNHPGLTEKVLEVIKESGPCHGITSEYEYLAAEELRKHFPSCERIRWLQSGTETDMLAIRVARVFTGKKHVIKVGGSYHGWSDQLVYDLNQGFINAMDDDLNISATMAAIFTIIRQINILIKGKKIDPAGAEKIIDGFRYIDEVLEIFNFKEKLSDERIQQLLNERQKAKEEENWELADKIRDQLIAKVLSVRDNKI